MHGLGAFVTYFSDVSLLLTETKFRQKVGALIPVEKVDMGLQVNHNHSKTQILAN